MVGRPHRRVWSCATLAALGLAAPGCSGKVDELPREAVPGTVRLDGRPLASGTIVFLPSGEQKSKHTVSSSDVIENGRFLIPRAKGLVPTKYRIAIYGGKKHEGLPNPDIGPEQAPPPAKDFIPEKYNVETELEVEIKPGGIRELKIELVSK
ncbi:MAG: hypothetical protein ACHRXM_35220 [Isosphaerales bacterium]